MSEAQYSQTNTESITQSSVYQNWRVFSEKIAQAENLNVVNY